jgi:hypothetical protein
MKEIITELVQKIFRSYGIRYPLFKTAESSHSFLSYFFKVHNIIFSPTPLDFPTETYTNPTAS